VPVIENYYGSEKAGKYGDNIKDFQESGKKPSESARHF